MTGNSLALARDCQRTEVRVGNHHAARRRPLGNRQPMPVRDVTALAPLGNGAGGMAEFGRDTFDRRLHDGETIDRLSMKSTRYAFDNLSVAQAGLSTHPYAMKALKTPTVFQKEMGRRIALAREACGGLTQQGLADRIGIDHGSISLWEKGKRALNAWRTAQIAAALDVTAEWLILGDDRLMAVEVMRRIRALAGPNDVISLNRFAD